MKSHTTVDVLDYGRNLKTETEELENKSGNIKILSQTTPFLANTYKNNTILHTILDERIINLIYVYYFYSLIYRLTTLSEDSDIIQETGEYKEEKEEIIAQKKKEVEVSNKQKKVTSIKLLGKTEGCTHLVELLNTIATTAFQTIYPYSINKVTTVKEKPKLLNKCYAYSENSPIVKKLFPDFYKP